MAAKLVVVLAAVVALAQCSVVPLVKADTDYSSFAYNVADPYSGDFKSQVESRSGGNVQGQYSLIEPDGFKRVVDYAADDVNGFNAVVRKEPGLVATPVAAVAPAVVAARVATPSVVAAPAVLASHSYTPSVYSASSPAFFAARSFAPTVYSASAPAFYSSRSYLAPSLYSSSPLVTARYASPYYSAYGAGNSLYY